MTYGGTQDARIGRMASTAAAASRLASRAAADAGEDRRRGALVSPSCSSARFSSSFRNRRAFFGLLAAIKAEANSTSISRFTSASKVMAASDNWTPPTGVSVYSPGTPPDTSQEQAWPRRMSAIAHPPLLYVNCINDGAARKRCDILTSKAGDACGGAASLGADRAAARQQRWAA